LCISRHCLGPFVFILFWDRISRDNCMGCLELKRSSFLCFPSSWVYSMYHNFWLAFSHFFIKLSNKTFCTTSYYPVLDLAWSVKWSHLSVWQDLAFHIKAQPKVGNLS
jgi:hypothetical protein